MSKRRTTDPSPEDWILWLTAARDLMCGATQEQAAAGVSRTGRTIRLWMTHPKWKDAEAEAQRTFFPDTTREALATVRHHIRRKNVTVAQWWLERTDPKFAPKSKHEHSGPDGGPIETRELALEELTVEQLAARAAQLAAENAKQ